MQFACPTFCLALSLSGRDEMFGQAQRQLRWVATCACIVMLYCKWFAVCAITPLSFLHVSRCAPSASHGRYLFLSIWKASRCAPLAFHYAMCGFEVFWGVLLLLFLVFYKLLVCFDVFRTVLGPFWGVLKCALAMFFICFLYVSIDLRCYHPV